MNELFLAVTAVLLCSLVYGMVIAVLWAQLRDMTGLYKEQVADLLSRLVARDPAEYQAWMHRSPFMEAVRPESRLFDETGLLSVPEEDRGVD